jgi:bifunctional non-homologous end joining protein LigD
LASLKVKNAILDGELVVLGPDGRSQFLELMRRRTQQALYYAFDLVWLDGQDLRPLPLLDSKAALRQILRLGKVPAILGADHVQGIGSAFYKAVCERDCEGVVAKHKLAPRLPRF